MRKRNDLQPPEFIRKQIEDFVTGYFDQMSFEDLMSGVYDQWIRFDQMGYALHIYKQLSRSKKPSTDIDF